MPDRTQRVNGAVQVTGPQPAQASQVSATLDLAASMGSLGDTPATNGREGSVIAILAGVSTQLQETNELLLELLNHFRGRH